MSKYDNYRAPLPSEMCTNPSPYPCPCPRSIIDWVVAFAQWSGENMSQGCETTSHAHSYYRTLLGNPMAEVDRTDHAQPKPQRSRRRFRSIRQVDARSICPCRIAVGGHIVWFLNHIEQDALLSQSDCATCSISRNLINVLTTTRQIQFEKAR